MRTSTEAPNYSTDASGSGSLSCKQSPRPTGDVVVGQSGDKHAELFSEPKTHQRSTSHEDLLRDMYREVMDDPHMEDGPPPGPPVDIPVLPSGRVLKFHILSTWGDPHYVGLAGVELFDGQGHLIRLQDAARQVHALPEAINTLPEYGADPRTVDKLFDGVNLTRDDLHVWLAPFDRREKEHSITVRYSAGVWTT